MNESDIYRQAEDCLMEDMDGELLLYHPPSAVTLHLNGPSAVVWQLIDGQRSVSDIIAIVKEAYPAQAEQIADDVVGVVVDLSERQVVEKVKVEKVSVEKAGG